MFLFSTFYLSIYLRRPTLDLFNGSIAKEDVMVYFPETGTAAAAAATTVAAAWTERIDSEDRYVAGPPLTPVESNPRSACPGTAARPCTS